MQHISTAAENPALNQTTGVSLHQSASAYHKKQKEHLFSVSDKQLHDCTQSSKAITSAGDSTDRASMHQHTPQVSLRQVASQQAYDIDTQNIQVNAVPRQQAVYTSSKACKKRLLEGQSQSNLQQQSGMP